MYTSTEDARSDLFLSGAVFLFGGIIVQAVLRIIPLDRIPGLGAVLAVVLPLVTTVLVPYLLIRYRKEPWIRAQRPVRRSASGCCSWFRW